jgi:NAD+ diphosphatase
MTAITPGAQRVPGWKPVPTPSATPSSFVIDVPLLSRGTADRSEDLRSPDRIAQMWPAARMLMMDARGRVGLAADRTRLATVPAAEVADAPPADAVLLGAIDGVDYWAMPADDSAAAIGREVPGESGGLREWGTLLPDGDAGLLTTATALLTWHAAAGFCPRCGQPSTPRPAGWSRVCPQGHEDFPRTDPAVIVLVHDGADSMVLARQPIWPVGRMSVLAGFVEAGESLEHTVAREVLEEVGVHVTDVSYLGAQPWPVPRSLMVGFAARAHPGAPLFPREGEIEQARWFHRDEVRAMIAAEDPAVADSWTEPTPMPGGSAFEVVLPGPVSIARRMIEGWIRAD